MIREEQLSQLYKSTAQLYGRKEPNASEFQVWKDLFADACTFGDLDSALRRWNSDTTIEEFTRRPKGSRMPTPAELKASIEAFDRQEAAKDHFIPCGKCEEGWIRVTSGQTVGGNGKKNPVNAQAGAVKRCECFFNWARSRKVG